MILIITSIILWIGIIWFLVTKSKAKRQQQEYQLEYQKVLNSTESKIVKQIIDAFQNNEIDPKSMKITNDKDGFEHRVIFDYKG